MQIVELQVKENQHQMEINLIHFEYDIRKTPVSRSSAFSSAQLSPNAAVRVGTQMQNQVPAATPILHG
ncbi:hypothetical protein SCA6_016032 [Theobroma cacao]